MPRPRTPDLHLVLTCEHAGNRIPAAYAPLFRGAARVLASHVGWDPGALRLARHLARHLDTRLLQTSWSRLLVEANRSLTNPGLWSAYTRGLDRDEKRAILDRYWWPHRRAVEAEIERVVQGGHRAFHVAVHSFTPVLDGEVRAVDVGLLYDPGRPAERALCARWRQVLLDLAPDLRVRRNQPYRGVDDGLSTALRGRFPDRAYAAVELETNQALVDGAGRRRLQRVLGESLERLLG